jgi:hypothetical protein
MHNITVSITVSPYVGWVRGALPLRGRERIDVSGFGASHRPFKRPQVPKIPAASALPLTNA